MIKKAVITAAGKGTRQYPATNTIQKELFPLVDMDGITKPTIQVIAEQVFNAGIEELCIVVQPGEEKQFKNHFHGLSKTEKPAFNEKKWANSQSDLLEKFQKSIVYIHQTRQEGYGHAVFCTREWVGDDPFLLLLGDHIYISNENDSCITQLLNAYKNLKKPIFGVQQTLANSINLFGTVYAEKRDQDQFYQILQVAEKPSLEYARKNLQISNLPKDIFFTFFGMYILTPTIFDILDTFIQKDIREKNEIQLSSAQNELCNLEHVIGQEINGIRLDMGTPMGYLETQLALGIHGIFSSKIKHVLEKLDTQMTK